MRRLCKSSAVRAQVLLNSVPVGTVHSKERALRSQTISFSCAACGPAAHASFRCRSRLYTYRRSIMCAHRLVVENHSFSRWHPLFKIITVEAQSWSNTNGTSTTDVRGQRNWEAAPEKTTKTHTEMRTHTGQDRRGPPPERKEREMRMRDSLVTRGLRVTPKMWMRETRVTRRRIPPEIRAREKRDQSTCG